MSWKAMMAIAAKRGLKIRQINVVTAYLFGFLDEKVYIRQSVLEVLSQVLLQVSSSILILCHRDMAEIYRITLLLSDT